MMRSPTRLDLVSLMSDLRPPCVSIYLPTDRSYPAEQQGPIRYKNALTAAEEQLRQKYPGHQVNGLLDRFRALSDDQYFWFHRFDGLAVFGGHDRFEIFDLQRQPPEATVVADSFHLKPLVRYTQSADRFQMLCLQAERAWLLEGDRYSLDEIDPKGMPTTIQEALGEEIVLGREVVGAYGPGTGGTHHAPGKPNVPHGHAAEGSDRDRDTRRFFLKIDKEVWERHSRPTGLPLVLAALPQHQSHFRELSKNQHLVPEGIEKDPGAFKHADRGELVRTTWKVVEPFYLNRLNRFKDDYHVARARGKGSDDVDAVAEAACHGRVGILLVDADKHLPGRLDRATGRCQRTNLERPDVDDLLDDIGEVVLGTDGTVVMVPSERMPTPAGLAAIYRY